MAQYGQGFYGEMYYGVMGAKYGTYSTNMIETEGKFKFQGDMSIVVTLEDIKVNYKTKVQSLSQVDVFSFGDNWTDTGTNFVSSADNAVVDFLFTGSNCSVVYSGGPINYAITTTDSNGVVTVGATGTLPANGTLTEVAIPTTKYTNYDIKLTCPTGTTIDSGYVYVCGTKVDLKAANDKTTLDAAAFTELTIISETVTKVSDTKYLRKITYNANGLTGNCMYKYVITLFSSDSSQEVWVDKIEVESYQPQLYMIECTYTQSLDILTILGSTEYANMKQYDLITWVETVPSGTDVEIRTSSGSDLLTHMSDYSPKYKLNGTQARLKPGQTRGWVTTPLFNFDVLNGSANTTVAAKAFNVNLIHSLARSFTDAVYGLKFSIMVDGKEAIPRATSMNSEVFFRNIECANHKIQVLIEFMNGQNYFSPTLDAVGLTSQCLYKEIKNKAGLMLSAVEQIKDLTDITSYGFKVDTHPYINGATYKIHILNGVNVDYKLYFKSTSGINTSDSVYILKGANDTVCGYSKLPISISKRLQNVRFGDGFGETDGSYTLTLKVINNFKDPGLVQGKRYLFRVISGIVTDELSGDMYKITTDATTVDPLSTVRFATPYTNGQPSTGEYSEKSTFNNIASNDNVLLNTKFDTDVEEYVWTSEEKVYKGSINIFGDKQNYVMEIDKLPTLDTQVFFNNVISPDYVTNPQEIHIGPYRIKILENSVYCVPKENSLIPVDRSRIEIKDISLVQDSTVEEATSILTRGSKHYTDGLPANSDEIPALYIEDIIDVIQVTDNGDGTVSSTTFVRDVSWTFDSGSKAIIWTGSGAAPALNSQYTVKYKYRPYVSANVSLECDYSEDVNEKRGWTSKYRYLVSGTCSTNQDSKTDVTTLAAKNNVEVWKDILELTGDTTIDPATLRYIIYSCDNEYVQCSISGNLLTATMSGLNPKEDWMMKINGGYYYLGKDEFYKYIDKRTVNINTDIPIISNCEYIAGATNDSGAIVSHDSITSMLINNDFNENIIGTSISITPSADTSIVQSTDSKVFWL